MDRAADLIGDECGLDDIELLDHQDFDNSVALMDNLDFELEQFGKTFIEENQDDGRNNTLQGDF